MSIDVMLDLETTGVEAGCCILSIGACTLDGTEKFYVKIAHESCLHAGLGDLPSTMAWWQKQSEEARKEAFSGQEPIVSALGMFADWFSWIQKEKGGGDAYIWGNGADFDLPILGAAYKAVSMNKPWKPFNGRCFRTIKNLPNYKHIKAEKFEGVKHNALADALNQASHLLTILRVIKGEVASRTAMVSPSGQRGQQYQD